MSRIHVKVATEKASDTGWPDNFIYIITDEEMEKAIGMYTTHLLSTPIPSEILRLVIQEHSFSELYGWCKLMGYPLPKQIYVDGQWSQLKWRVEHA